MDEDQQVATPHDSQDVAGAYRLHKAIEQTHKKIERVRSELSNTHWTEKSAFIGTFLVYFVFIWGLYVSELWGFATWLKANLSETLALPVFAVLGVTLPYSMAKIKSIVYEHIALYDVRLIWAYIIVLFLMLAGVTYEAISSSGQQQHIAHASAEGSKSFQAVMNTDASVGDNGALAAQLAKAESKLAACKVNLAEGKYKDCAQSQAAVESLKTSLQSASSASAQASVAAIEAKAKAAATMKEDGFKPVYKMARDVFGVTISTGVMMVAIVVSLIFEISHALLVLVMRQKENFLTYLESGIIEKQADYLSSTGKVHALDDFTDTSILDMDTLREKGQVQNGVGFTATIRPVTAYHAPTHNRQTMADFEAARAQSRPFGFAGAGSAYSQQSTKPKPAAQLYAGLSALALLDKKQLAKSQPYGAVVECPTCGTRFTKTNVGQIFCCKEHKGVFNKMLQEAS